MSKNFLLFILVLVIFFPEKTHAQKNGVTGYGKIESNIVFAKFSRDVYLGAGGGVIVNDNLQFGAFLKALAKPYNFSAIKSINDSISFFENPYSKNENAFSTTINNIEFGATAGFNIAPEKPLQATIRASLGYSSVTLNEISILDDPSDPTKFIVEDKTPILSGINASLEVAGQVKIGKSFKLSLLAGYHFSYVNGRNGKFKNVLKNPFMFSGFYLGSGIAFGGYQ